MVRWSSSRPAHWGSLLFVKAARAAGNQARVRFAETGTLPYLVRKHGPASIVVSVYATRLPTGVFPAADADEVIGLLQQAYPSSSLAATSSRAR